MSINKLLINCANAPQSIQFSLSMSVVINCFCPKTGDENGAEHLFTQLAALALVPSFVYNCTCTVPSLFETGARNPWQN
jgi:hypothetical protein